MKYRNLIAIILIIVVALSACGKKDLDPTPIQSEQSPEATHENIDMSPEDVISSMLVDPNKVFEETTEQLKENKGANIGTDYDQRQVADEGIMYTATDGENPFMPLAKRLNEVDGINGSNQAFYIKFMPSEKDFGIMLSAEVNLGLTIGDEGEPILFVAEHEYMEHLETDVRITPNNWYHVLIAIGSDGIVQGALWQEGKESEAAYMNLHVSTSFNDDRYSNQSWQVNVGYHGEATFTIQTYAYYTFSSFVLKDRVIDVSTDYKTEIPQLTEEVINTILLNPQELFGETASEMAENEGGQFGGGVSEKRVNIDEARLEIFSGDNGVYIPLNTRLRDFGGDNRVEQAILIKFQPENADGLYFNFVGMGEFGISFEPDDVYFVDVPNFSKNPFSDYANNDFKLKRDCSYNLLVAFDADAKLRCIVWEDGNYENQACLDREMYTGLDNIFESNWMLGIGFNGYGQLNIYEYMVYTFDNLTDDPFILNSNKTGDMHDENQDFSQDPMDMAATLLGNANVIFMENAAMMDENNGDNIGEVDVKRLSDDGSYYQFISNDDGAYMSGSSSLLDFGEFRGNAQAIMLKVRSKNINELAFKLVGEGEVALSFINNQPIFTHVADFYSAPYTDYRNSSLNLEGDKWYWIIMAFDSQSNYSSLVWEDQNAENNAFCSENLGERRNEYIGSNWNMIISLGDNMTLDMQQYYIMDFDGFIQ